MAGAVAGAAGGAKMGLNGTLGKAIGGCLGFAALAGFADFAGDTIWPNRSARIQAKQHTYGGTGSLSGVTGHGGGGHH